MSDNQHIFNEYYNRPINCIKWFEPFVDPIILDEYNSSSLQEGMSLLDIGAGCSLDSIFYASKGLHVTAVDFSQNALEKLRELSSLIGVSINIINSSVITLPKEFTNQFDIVSDNGCFHHINPVDRADYVDNIVRVLKQDGILYIRAHSDVGGVPSPGVLRANRISSDTIIETFFPRFIIDEMRSYNYVRTHSGFTRVWFIKLKKRKSSK